MKRTMLLGCLVALMSTAGFAQTRWSVASFGASNTDFADNGTVFIPFIDSEQAKDGTRVDLDFGRSWSGMDRDDEPRTMHFSGSTMAQGDYGLLRTSATGFLSNSFYNEANAPYHNTQTDQTNEDGVPDLLDANAYAQWTDKLQFGGTAINYTSTWVFRVTGFNSGVGRRSQLQVKIGNNPLKAFNFQQTGAFDEVLRVSGFVQGAIQETITMTLVSNVRFFTQNYGDGTDLEGMSNFGNTVKLEGIEMRDEANTLLGDLDITSASGYQYEVVPEPATFAALGVGLMALARRRRR